jgi:hypothetical protein
MISIHVDTQRVCTREPVCLCSGAEFDCQCVTGDDTALVCLECDEKLTTDSGVPVELR